MRNSEQKLHLKTEPVPFEIEALYSCNDLTKSCHIMGSFCTNLVKAAPNMTEF